MDTCGSVYNEFLTDGVQRNEVLVAYDMVNGEEHIAYAISFKEYEKYTDLNTNTHDGAQFVWEKCIPAADAVVPPADTYVNAAAAAEAALTANTLPELQDALDRLNDLPDAEKTANQADYDDLVARLQAAIDALAPKDTVTLTFDAENVTVTDAEGNEVTESVTVDKNSAYTFTLATVSEDVTITEVSDGTNVLEADEDGVYTVDIGEEDVTVTVTTESGSTGDDLTVEVVAGENTELVDAEGNPVAAGEPVTLTVTGLEAGKWYAVTGGNLTGNNAARADENGNLVFTYTPDDDDVTNGLTIEAEVKGFMMNPITNKPAVLGPLPDGSIGLVDYEVLAVAGPKARIAEDNSGTEVGSVVALTVGGESVYFVWNGTALVLDTGLTADDAARIQNALDEAVENDDVDEETGLVNATLEPEDLSIKGNASVSEDGSEINLSLGQPKAIGAKLPTSLTIDGTVEVEVEWIDPDGNVVEPDEDGNYLATAKEGYTYNIKKTTVAEEPEIELGETVTITTGEGENKTTIAADVPKDEINDFTTTEPIVPPVDLTEKKAAAKSEVAGYETEKIAKLSDADKATAAAAKTTADAAIDAATTAEAVDKAVADYKAAIDALEVPAEKIMVELVTEDANINLADDDSKPKEWKTDTTSLSFTVVATTANWNLVAQADDENVKTSIEKGNGVWTVTVTGVTKATKITLSMEREAAKITVTTDGQTVTNALTVTEPASKTFEKGSVTSNTQIKLTAANSDVKVPVNAKDMIVKFDGDATPLAHPYVAGNPANLNQNRQWEYQVVSDSEAIIKLADGITIKGDLVITAAPRSSKKLVEIKLDPASTSVEIVDDGKFYFVGDPLQSITLKAKSGYTLPTRSEVSSQVKIQMDGTGGYVEGWTWTTNSDGTATIGFGAGLPVTGNVTVKVDLTSKVGELKVDLNQATGEWSVDGRPAAGLTRYYYVGINNAKTAVDAILKATTAKTTTDVPGNWAVYKELKGSLPKAEYGQNKKFIVVVDVDTVNGAKNRVVNIGCAEIKINNNAQLFKVKLSSDSTGAEISSVKVNGTDVTKTGIPYGTPLGQITVTLAATSAGETLVVETVKMGTSQMTANTHYNYARSTGEITFAGSKDVELKGDIEVKATNKTLAKALTVTVSDFDGTVDVKKEGTAVTNNLVYFVVNDETEKAKFEAEMETWTTADVLRTVTKNWTASMGDKRDFLTKTEALANNKPASVFNGKYMLVVEINEATLSSSSTVVAGGCSSKISVSATPSTDVIPANRNLSLDRDPWTGKYAVTASVDPNAGNTVNVVLDAQDVKDHANSNGDVAPWLGVGILDEQAAKEATSVTWYSGWDDPRTTDVTFGNTEGTHYDDTMTVGGKEYKTFYFGAASAKSDAHGSKGYVAVKYTYAGGATETFTYVLDFSRVTIAKAVSDVQTYVIYDRASLDAAHLSSAVLDGLLSSPTDDLVGNDTLPWLLVTLSRNTDAKYTYVVKDEENRTLATKTATPDTSSTNWDAFQSWSLNSDATGDRIDEALASGSRTLTVEIHAGESESGDLLYAGTVSVTMP